MSGSIKKNLGFQTVFQVLSTALPLITAPYLSRTMGASQQGVFSYTNSIVSYFTLFAMLGINNHGTREIAKVNTDVDNRSRVFCEIYTLQVFMCSMTIVLYVWYLICFCSDNLLIAKIQILAILACLFDINWFYFGIENFKITVTRNIIIKCITVVLILLLVKSPRDLWMYTILMTASAVVSNIILIFILPKYVSGVSICGINQVKKHIKPAMVLFIPVLAMTVYHVMDKTMLGIFSDYNNCGYYYNADKIINIPIGIIAGISTVLFPRVVAVFSAGNKKQFERLFNQGLEGSVLVATILACGIAAISKEFTPFFFGPGFETCIKLIIVLAPVMVIKSISTVLRYQYLIPLNKEKYFIYSVIAGAFINIVANCLLIPQLGAMGAVIGTLIAEFVSCSIQIYYVQQDLNVCLALIRSIPYLLIGLCMYSGVRCVAEQSHYSQLVSLSIEIIIGGAISISLLYLYSILAKGDTVVKVIFKSAKLFFKR